MTVNKAYLLLFTFILFKLTAFAQTEAPTLITNLDADVSETSGLIFYNEKLWTHNDSGTDATLFCIDTLTGAVVSTKGVRNAVNIDWEDICNDETWAYIGDFGNNAGTRENFQIYRIPLSELDNNMLDSVNAELISFNYDPSIYPEVTKSDNTDFDCEAMIVIEDSLYLFSKNWLNKKCYTYAIPIIPGTYTAYRRDTLNTQGLICGADYNVETNTVCLIGYVYGIPAPSLFFLLSGFENDDFFTGTTVRYVLELNGYQTESAVFKDNTRVWITNENFLGHTQSLYEITLPGSDADLIFSSEETMNIYPNPANDEINVILNNSGKFRYQITDCSGLVINKSCKKQTFDESIKIDISHLKPGRYCFEIFDQNSTISSSFIKL